MSEDWSWGKIYKPVSPTYIPDIWTDLPFISDYSLAAGVSQPSLFEIIEDQDYLLRKQDGILCI